MCRVADALLLLVTAIHCDQGTRHNTTLDNPNHPSTSTIHRRGTPPPKSVGQSLIRGIAFAALSQRS
jgi:hypothetical protein